MASTKFNMMLPFLTISLCCLRIISGLLILSAYNEHLIRQSVQKCPTMAEKLLTLCSSEASCRNACGEMKSNAQSTAHVCSCDILCTVHKDCCFDFELQCPQLSNQSKILYHHLQETQPSCVLGFAALATCPGYKADSLSTLNITKGKVYENVIVTDLGTGVLYKNISVYQCNNPGNVQTNHLEFWSKAYYSYNYVSILDAKQALENRTLQTTSAGIEQRAPEGAHARECPAITDIHCEDCPWIMRINNLTFACEVIDNLQNINEFRRPYLLLSSTTLMTTTGISSTTDELFKIRAIEDSENNDVETCKAYFKSVTKRRLDPPYSALFSLRGNVEHLKFVHVISLKNPWSSVTCERSNKQDPCIFNIDCSYGFVLIDGKCLKPISLVLQISIKLTSGRLHYIPPLAEITYIFTDTRRNLGTRTIESHSIVNDTQASYFIFANLDEVQLNHNGDLLAYSYAILPTLQEAQYDADDVFTQIVLCIGTEKTSINNIRSMLTNTYSIYTLLPRCDILTSVIDRNGTRRRQDSQQLLFSNSTQLTMSMITMAAITLILTTDIGPPLCLY